MGNEGWAFNDNLNTSGKGDWVWLQHTLAFFKDNGRAAVVLDTGAVTRGSGSKNEDTRSRSASPTLIAEYQTALPDKQLLRRKLDEFYQLALPHAAPAPHKPALGSHAKEVAVLSPNKKKLDRG